MLADEPSHGPAVAWETQVSILLLIDPLAALVQNHNHCPALPPHGSSKNSSHLANQGGPS